MKKLNMRINRQTYEEFFLLYNDGELSLDEKKAVEEFVRENPDLEEELILLQGTVFAPDENVVFDNKELLFREEKKNVVAFPWFRLAAAAVLLITFCTIGWLYLNSNDPLRKGTLASKELVKQENPDGLKKVEPEVTTVADNYDSPMEEVGTNIKAKEEPVSIRVSYQAKKKAIINPAIPEENIAQPATSEASEVETDPSSINHDIVQQASLSEIPDITVAPRDAPKSAVAVPVSTVEYVESESDNMIYFANTSLPKKSKLRGVFRKATRILDKVTSLQ